MALCHSLCPMNNALWWCIFKALVLTVHNNDRKFAYLHAMGNKTRIRSEDSYKCYAMCIKFKTSIFVSKCQNKAAPSHTMKACKLKKKILNFD